MASVLEVQKKLAELIEPIIYPNGTGSPSIINKDIKIIDGYPVKDTLDKWLDAGKAMISISTIEKSDQNTTRYTKRWQSISAPDATVEMVLGDDYVITITGVAADEQVATIKTSSEVASHQISAGESMNDIAAALGVQLTGAVVVDNTIAIPNEFNIQLGVGVLGKVAKEIKRQNKRFCVTIWTPTYIDRDAIGEAIDVYLSDIERFVLPDDFYARIIYNGTVDIDDEQTHRIYKRELEYLIEYATTLTEEATSFVVYDVQIEDNRR